MTTRAERRLAAKLSAATLAGALAAAFGSSFLHTFTVERDLDLSRWTGYVALTFLAAALAMTPLIRLHAVRDSGLAAALRRAFGISAAAAAALHAAIALAGELVPELSLLLYEPQFRSGAAALSILALLAFTSFPKIVQALHIQLWKELHRLAYAAAFLALHHLALSPFAGIRTIAAFAAIFTVLALVRLIAPRTHPPDHR